MLNRVWADPASYLTRREPLYPTDRTKPVEIWVGTSPVEMGQSVWIAYQQFNAEGEIIPDEKSKKIISGEVIPPMTPEDKAKGIGKEQANPIHYAECNWRANESGNSYWCARIEKFDENAASVVYNIYARQGKTVLTPPSPDLYSFEFPTGPIIPPPAPHEAENKPPLWTTGAKTGVGTAVGSESKVWFCHSRGILNEIYYPKLDVPNTRDFQFLVLDAEKKFNNPQKMDSKVEYLDTLQPGSDGIPRSLAYRITNYDKSSQPGVASRTRYELSMDVFTHPSEDALLVKMKYTPLAPDAKNYRIFGLLAPHMNNSGWRDSCKFVNYQGQVLCVAWDNGIYCAVAADRAWPKFSCGFVGDNDGWKLLERNHDLTPMYGSATDGNLAITFELELPAADPTALVVLAFGTTEAEALDRAHRLSACSATKVANQYMSDWKKHVKKLAAKLKAITKGQDARTTNLAYVSAMVLKVCQDKQYPGAGIASPSVPWGDCVGDSNSGGYHLVWGRDLYHSSTGAIAVGDYATAIGALKYLDNIQQEKDGSMPQNTWLNGTPYWGGEQLDETAMAIILAWRLEHDPNNKLAGQVDYYNSLVKDAADFLLGRSDSFTQDRWEEKWGLSPNTIASVVAGLILAARWADQKNDGVKRDAYRQKALQILSNDLPKCWVDQGNGYYARLNNIRHVIDGGFLELVRLGIKSPTSAKIASSLTVVDNCIRVDIDANPYFLRYGRVDKGAGDGMDTYGDCDDGSGWTGNGRGRRWPLLTGERGHFELDRGSIAAARGCLKAMVDAANEGYMLCEQVWDADSIPGKYMIRGKGTGSATPLAWTHAEFLKLLRSIAENRSFDRLEEVDKFMKLPEQQALRDE